MDVRIVASPLFKKTITRMFPLGTQTKMSLLCFSKRKSLSVETKQNLTKNIATKQSRLITFSEGKKPAVEDSLGVTYENEKKQKTLLVLNNKKQVRIQQTIPFKKGVSLIADGLVKDSRNAFTLAVSNSFPIVGRLECGAGIDTKGLFLKLNKSVDEQKIGVSVHVFDMKKMIFPLLSSLFVFKK